MTKYHHMPTFIRHSEFGRRCHVASSFLFLVFAPCCALDAAQLSVAPVSASLTAGQSQQFVATRGTGRAPVWSVNATAGGSTSTGTISANGLYLAPSSITSAISVQITASTTKP